MLSYLKDLPDVCRVQGHGMHTKVSGVSVKSNQHITDFISKQDPKGSKPRKFGKTRPNRPIPAYLKNSFADMPKPADDDDFDDWNPPPSSKQVAADKTPELDLNQLVERIEISNTSRGMQWTGGEAAVKPVAEFDEWNPPPSSKTAAQLPEKIDFSFKIFPSTPSTPPKIGGDCVKAGSKIPTESCLADFNSLQFVPLVVLEIYSPYKFWFTTRQNAAKMDNLQREINSFYSQIQPEELRVGSVQVGFFYAVRCDGFWVRAEVVDEKQDDRAMIKVFLIDFGAVMKVNLRYVKALLKRFAEHPRQVTRGRLASVKPRNAAKWTRKAVEAFKQLVDNRILYGTLQKHDANSDLMYLTLLDSAAGVDVAKRLEALGIADACDVDGENSVHLRFPTFKMIETGMSASIVD